MVVKSTLKTLSAGDNTAIVNGDVEDLNANIVASNSTEQPSVLAKMHPGAVIAGNLNLHVHSKARSLEATGRISHALHSLRDGTR